ncbi:phage tail sheath C-terminal domain-containing protein [Bacillus sp. FJAT-45350]|uniref:phage tail sheath C-terminal domain-containing protein n=1 Tax=Bacillus sp. FJAT-45350 TaxID=2011014 RepID=UPI000BB9AB93|nr:phage tail sheath C-terminal domain-containing protein [Bacillus sp. FJAT-45350]
MGLPQIDIVFKGQAVTAVNRSAMGIVLLMVKDATANFLNDFIAYRDITQVNEENWSEENFDYISQAFMGTPSRVLVCNLGPEGTVSDGLQKSKSKKWNYLAVPFAEEETTSIASFIKSQRENEKKTFKAVLANEQADHEGIINFTTDEIVVGEKIYTTAEYTPRIAGILAGLPFTRSATYFSLPEVDSIKEHDDPDADIDNGQLILVNDGEEIKIGRAVNSLTSFTVKKTEDFSVIKVMEVMDMMHDDIYSTFKNEYVGKVQNIYDNQVLFFTSVNAYYQGLEGDVILDPNFDNRAEINVEAQRLAWETIGTDTSDWDDQKVKEMSFKRNVFTKGRVKIVDAIEDLEFQVSI